MAPVSLDSFGNLCARHFYRLTLGESRQAYEHVVLIALNASHRNPSYLAQSRCAGIGDVGVYYLVLCRHAPHGAYCHEESGCC